MRPFLTLFAFSALLLVGVSCKKDKKISACFPDAITVRQITDKPAIIKVTATISSVYIIEQGAIDTKLLPCNFPMEFYQNDLPVIISGDVKLTLQNGTCCAQNFVITKITR